MTAGPERPFVLVMWPWGRNVRQAKSALFRVRSHDRDGQTDRRRWARLRTLLTEISAELLAEKAGLQSRYDNAAADAAFSQQAVEDDGAAATAAKRIDGLTASLVAYGDRIAGLDRQLAFVARLTDEIDGFAAAQKPASKI